MNLSYLFTELPPERYAQFRRGNLLILTGALIAILETFVAIYFNLIHFSLEKTFSISIILISIAGALYFNASRKKAVLVWQDWAFFFIYMIIFLSAFCYWTYKLQDLRLLAIINGITTVTIVLSYTKFVQSLMISAGLLTCYFSVSWYAIKVAGQPGSLEHEAFFSFCLIPSFLLISSSAYYINRRREAIQHTKNQLEILNNELTEANNKLNREQMLTGIEMDLASEIQKAIFPRSAPSVSDWDIAVMTKPYGAVSGDFYDFYLEDNSLKGLSLFDVSGHGVAPALITILAKPVIQTQFERCNSLPLGDVLENANDLLQNELEAVNIYITGILLRIKGESIEYINAGHPELIHFHTDSGKAEIIGSAGKFKGQPLGILISGEKYALHKFNVSSGDFLILFSDGLNETRNDHGEMFGTHRIFNTINSYHGSDSSELLDLIVKSLDEFRGNCRSRDDITIIVARKI